MKTDRGCLFVFEGPDGVGKTTIIGKVFSDLAVQGLSVEKLSFPGKKPGTLGKLIYDLHHTPTSFGISKLVPASLQILHIAAHVESIINIILPFVKEGKIVLLDRFWWSTFVYGKLGGIEEAALYKMITTELHFWEEMVPDGVFLLSRKISLKKELDLNAWNTAKEEYFKLKVKEENKYPVFLVENENSIEETLERILTKIFEITNYANRD